MSSPGLYTKDFDIERAESARPPRSESPEQIARDEKIRESLTQGLSYPQIAYQLGIGVGTHGTRLMAPAVPDEDAPVI